MRGRKNRLFFPLPLSPLSPSLPRVPSRCIVAKSWQQGKEKCIDSSPGGRRLWRGLGALSWRAVRQFMQTVAPQRSTEPMRKSLCCCMSVLSISTFTVQRSWTPWWCPAYHERWLNRCGKVYLERVELCRMRRAYRRDHGRSTAHCVSVRQTVWHWMAPYCG